MKDLTEIEMDALKHRLFSTIKDLSKAVSDRIVLQHLTGLPTRDHPAVKAALTHWAHDHLSIDQVRAHIIKGTDLDEFIAESVKAFAEYNRTLSEEKKAELDRLGGIVKEVFGDK